MARISWSWVIVAAVAVNAGVVTRGAQADPVPLRETHDHVTESMVIVEASPEEIYAAITDYRNWQHIFSDVLAVTVKAGGRDDATVRFTSRAFDRTISVKFSNVRDRLIRFRGLSGPPSGQTRGEYVLTPIGDGSRTQVTARLYVHVVGPASMFVDDRKVTGMRREKLRSDLADASRWFVYHRHSREVRAPASTGVVGTGAPKIAARRAQ